MDAGAFSAFHEPLRPEHVGVSPQSCIPPNGSHIEVHNGALGYHKFAEGDVLVRGVCQEVVRRWVKTQGFEHYALQEWSLQLTAYHVLAAGSPASDVVPQLLLDILFEDAY